VKTTPIRTPTISEVMTITAITAADILISFPSAITIVYSYFMGVSGTVKTAALRNQHSGITF
jgi:hypothetical protein